MGMRVLVTGNRGFCGRHLQTAFEARGDEVYGIDLVDCLDALDFFRDPRLQQVIGLALSNNPDLRVAMLNVDQTRALYRVQRDSDCGDTKRNSTPLSISKRSSKV